MRYINVVHNADIYYILVQYIEKKNVLSLKYCYMYLYVKTCIHLENKDQLH